MTEADIHQALVNQLRYRAVDTLTFWHTPNGAYHGSRPWEGARQKRYGVLPGVSDLIMVNEGKCYALELKADEGKPTKAQLKFLEKMAENGWQTAITHGLDAAIAKLEAWELIR
jgi:hypothetical protein